MRILVIIGLFLRSSLPVQGQYWNPGTAGSIYYNGGNVGIGTDAPSQKLDIVGSGAHWPLRLQNADGNHDWYFGVSGNSWLVGGNKLMIGTTGNSPDTEFTIDALGSVGIGTTTPLQKLDIMGSGTKWPLRLQNSDGNYDWHIGVSGDSWSIGGNKFAISTTAGSNDSRLVIDENGNVGIGTSLSSNPNNYTLAVNGKIGAKEVQVENTSTTWPDYVFAEDYDLRPLSEVENFIRENQHLPEIPSAEEVAQKGQNLGEMNALLLKKIEELTLYVIELKRENEAHAEMIKVLQDKIDN